LILKLKHPTKLRSVFWLKLSRLEIDNFYLQEDPMWKNYHMPETVEQVIDLLSDASSQTKIIAGGTDLMVEIRDGKWPGLEDMIDISRVRNLDAIFLDEAGLVHIQAN